MALVERLCLAAHPPAMVSQKLSGRLALLRCVTFCAAAKQYVEALRESRLAGAKDVLADWDLRQNPMEVAVQIQRQSAGSGDAGIPLGVDKLQLLDATHVIDTLRVF